MLQRTNPFKKNTSRFGGWGTLGSQTFLKEYFDQLQFLKIHPGILDPNKVALTLYDTPPTIDEKISIRFSFASKLVHMLRPSSPIHSIIIEMFFFLPEKWSGKDFESKLLNLEMGYNFLVEEYARIIKKGLLKKAIQSFKTYFQSILSCSRINDEKIIDTLLCKCVLHHTRGTIKERFLVFS